MIGAMAKRLGDAAAFMDKGGPINWIIALLYLAVLALVCERGAYFILTSYKRTDFLAALSRRAAALSNGRDLPWSAAIARSQAARVAERFVSNRDRASAALVEVVDREGAAIRAEMERGLEALSLIGNIAPLCGLLGTVTGLMAAFGKIEAMGGAVDIAALSGGIWEAMITTATGLAVAIPSVAFCRLFEKLADARAADMAYAVSVLTETLREDCLSCAAESVGARETA